MALNEHKNLTNANLHDPKDFSTASNSTTLTKNSSGNLAWVANGVVGSSNYLMQGYLTALDANYQYGVTISDNQSPYQLATDFGSATVDQTIAVTGYFRMGQALVVPEASTVSRIHGWFTSNGSADVTITICKLTPDPTDTAAVAPEVIDSITTGGGSSNSTVVAISETAFTDDSLAAGDIIFPMVKSAGEDTSTIYFNLTVQAYAY